MTMESSDKVLVRRCGVDDLFTHAGFADLCREAAAECANPELSAAAVNQNLYRVLEASGSTQCFRCGCGDALAGFALVLLAPSGHNGKRYATVESLFVGRAYRVGGAGVQMMAALEDGAREAGCEAIFYSAHVGTSLARLLFLRSDQYALTNHVFCRRLR